MCTNEIVYSPVINTQCTGCGKCISKCRHQVLEITQEMGYTIARVKQAEKCRGCRKCCQVCPTEAIHIMTKEITQPPKKKDKMKKTKGHISHMGIFIAVFLFGFPAIIMLLWNALIPSIIGWSAINYWQAIGLFLLCNLLFRTTWPHHWDPRAHAGFHREQAHFHEKMRGMSWEEKRQYIRSRLAGMNEEDEHKEN